MTFNSWVCTEANWDGGAVSVSTDGGINWWYLPAKIGNFHDQISTANTNSPFYGEGIFDGSTITNGCRNSSLPFQIKQYDISNLSGSDVRFRFSFFSDQLIELDGWYIDDVGVQVDVFEQRGEWLSQPIYPDENFGWSQIDGLVSQPNGTQVIFDVIDASSGLVLEGYSNRTLPIELLFDPVEVPSIQINAKLSSDNHYVTPSIEKLEMGVSSYFDAYHATNMLNETYNSQNLVINEQGQMSAEIFTEVSFKTYPGCPSIDTKITSFGDNVSYQSDYFSLDYNYQQTDSMIAEFANVFSVPTLADNITIIFDSTSNLDYFHYTPQCVLPSRNISIGVINNTNEIYSDMSNSGLSSIFLTNSFSTVLVDGVLQSPDNDENYQINLQPNQVLDLTYQIFDFVNPQSSIDNVL